MRAHSVAAVGLRAHQLAQYTHARGRIVAAARRRSAGKITDVIGRPATANLVVARRAVQLAVRSAVPFVARARGLTQRVRRARRAGVIARRALDVA